MAFMLDNLGARLGGAAGRGLAAGLEDLATAKARQLQEAHQRQQQDLLTKRLAQGLSQVEGFRGKSQDELQQLAQLGEKLLGPVLKSEMERPYAEGLARAFGYPGPEGAQEGQGVPRLRAQDIPKVAEFQLKEKGLAQKQAEPFMKELRAQRKFSKPVVDKAKEALELIESGKIEGPWITAIKPHRTLNKETQLYKKALEELVTYLGSSQKGQLSDARLKQIREGKIDLSDRPETAREKLQKIIDTYSAPEQEYKLSQDIIRKQGKVPSDLEQLVFEKSQQAPGSTEINELPSANTVKAGDAFQNDNGEIMVSDGTNWLPYDEWLLFTEGR